MSLPPHGEREARSPLPTPESTSSFWHSEPSALLLGHRSTRDLPTTADVVIIGSGITGASVAHHLLTTPRRHGGDDALSPPSNIVMLEAREACWGATGRNGGHCQPIFFEHPDHPSIGHFELANLRAIQSLIDTQTIGCEFIVQPGVRAIYSPTHLATIEHALQTVASNAPQLRAMMRLVTDQDELRNLRIPTAIGAVITDVAARLWPYKFVCHVLEHLLTNPVPAASFNLQTLTPVQSLSRSPTGTIVHTPRGDITARKVILATNAYTSHLLPPFADLIVPCRGQMSSLIPLPSISGPERLATSLGFLGDGIDDYLIQRPNERGGHLMFGGGRQFGPSIGIADDSVVDERTAHYLRSRLVDVFQLPEGGGRKDGEVEMQATHMWTGIMAFSRDDHPWVGAVPGWKGVYLAAGFTGHGMPNAWLTGKAVALMAAHTLRDDESGTCTVHAVEVAVRETELPECYLITPERMQAARELEDVESKDWAEICRGWKGGEGV